MEPAEQRDHLVLGDGVGFQLLAGDIPYLVDRTGAVHHRHDSISLGREAVKASRGPILQYIPELTAEVVSVNAGVRPQPRLELGDTVPGCAEP
ncbi:hypothetical protein GCM10011348_43770 [Marinobacterium nitratireducens]|uniref:Uncharacterized protein n=1 Tax=Marinobacterium nitratireducens TaxID=518897 RepID=A0A917ZNW5_9GAMM|nr:hypothetical protein GCM10011348_43770 [Marinobacterium nitratireducens]